MEAQTTEMSFGESRRYDQQIALRQIMKRIESEPFTGSRLAEGEIAKEFDDAVMAAAHYEQALMGYLGALGADVLVGYEDADSAQGELIVLSGVVPANALLNGRKACAQIIESCAEVLRVMLSVAVTTAAEDAGPTDGSPVVVRMRHQIELGGTINFEAGTMAGVARFRGAVCAWDEPRVSYLLGSTAEKGFQLAWAFPLVEQIYGPNRLRWRDLRSPDFEPAAREGVPS